MKRIDRFDPAADRGLEESERHYLEVHHPFARSIFRREDSRVKRYVANRALRQYDVNGNFKKEPDAWRFVLEEVDDDLEDAVAWLPEWVRETIWTDHLNCISNIRAYDVEPTVVHDYRTDQTALVKVLFQYERNSDESSDSSNDYYESDILPLLKSRLEDAFGFRLFITNKVLRQTDVEDLSEEGQVIAPTYRDQTECLRFDEFWFDNVDWAHEFFHAPEVRDHVQGARFGTVSGYLVEERCGVDKL